MKNSTIKLMAFLVMVATANITTAAVVYTDITDVTVTLAPSGPQTLPAPLDLNADLTIDFTINVSNEDQTTAQGTFSGESISIAAGTSNAVLTNNTTFKYATALVAGNLIQSTSTTWDNTGGVLAVNGSATNGFLTVPFSNAGNYPNAGDKYIAVKFVIGANTHYGWIRVSVVNSTSITIKDFAYEDVANQSIEAGQTVTGINKSLATTTIVKNNNNTIEVEFANAFSGTVEVVSLSGQVIRTENVNGTTCALDLTTVAKGIYIVVFTGKDGYASRKVAIQ